MILHNDRLVLNLISQFKFELEIMLKKNKLLRIKEWAGIKLNLLEDYCFVSNIEFSMLSSLNSCSEAIENFKNVKVCNFHEFNELSKTIKQTTGFELTQSQEFEGFLAKTTNDYFAEAFEKKSSIRQSVRISLV